MFRTVPLSIIRSFSLYTQQWYVSYSLRAGSGRPSWSCSQAVSKPVWHIPWKTPDDGQRNCPKHVEFYSKNKIEKLVHLVGFVIRIYHDAPSHELQCSSDRFGMRLSFFNILPYLPHRQHILLNHADGLLCSQL